MINFTISLPKAHKEFIESQVAEGGFESVSKYLDSILRAERRRKAEKELLALVETAEQSGPASPMTRADWDRLKRRVHERENLAKGSSRAKSSQTRRRRTGS